MTNVKISGCQAASKKSYKRKTRFQLDKTECIDVSKKDTCGVHIGDVPMKQMNTKAWQML